jgi:hypothetical protein
MELKESSKNHIVSLLDSILREQFSGEKAHAKPYLDRINFACPYCGDSHGGTYKKRGNIYWKNLKFHCYNGGCPKPHTTVVDFLKDHGKSFNQKDELIHVLDFIQANTIVVPTKDYLQVGIFNELRKGAIPLAEVKSKLNLLSKNLPSIPASISFDNSGFKLGFATLVGSLFELIALPFLSIKSLVLMFKIPLV